MTTSANTRAIRTLVLTDVVNSTALVERVGDQRAAAIFARVDRVTRDLLQDHHGLEIDRTDGFLLSFEDPLEAVAFTLAVHRVMREVSDEVGEPVACRAGVHLGEVILRQNPPEDVARGAKPLEVEGLAKPFAARVMSLAGGGQTLVSTPVVEDVRARTPSDGRFAEARWVDHGTWRLKGIREPVPLFEVGEAGVAPLRAPPDSEKAWRAITGPLGAQRETLKRAWAVPAVRGIVLVLALAAVVAAGWSWDQARLKVAMHPELVWRNGAPEGVGEWTGALPRGYRITRRGGRVQRVEHVSAAGTPLPLRDADSDPEDNGSIAGIDWLHLVFPCRQDTRPASELVFCGSWNSSFEQLSATTMVPRYQDDGRVAEVAYLDAGGSLQRVVEVTHEDEAVRYAWKTPHGVPVLFENRPSLERALLDARGFEVERRGLRPDDTVHRYDSGAAVVRTVRDPVGRELERALFDAEGAPLDRSGAQRVVTTRDVRGLPTRIEGFRPDGARALVDGCATRELVYDGEGRLTGQTCLDRESLPTSDAGGCARRSFQYATGELVEQCLDAAGAATASSMGWARLALRLDETGRPGEVRFADADGQSVLTRLQVDLVGSGHAVYPISGPGRIVAEHDARGLTTRVAWFLGDEPMQGAGGFAAWTVDRDPRGVVRRWQILGADGQAVEDKGCARLDLVVDTDQSVLEYRWFDARGEPALGALGFHLERVVHRLGRPIESSRFGVDDEPVVAADGAHRVEQELDDRGATLAQATFGVDGQPVAPDGYHLFRWTYGASGWVNESRWYDSLRRPVAGPEGCTVLVDHRSPPDWQGTMRCLGPDGELVVSRSGWASYALEIDGQTTTITTWDAQGQVSFQLVKTVLEDGKLVTLDRAGPGGPIDRERNAYDARGNPVRAWYVDDDGAPVVGPEGYAEQRLAWDDRGNQLRSAWFGPGGEPMDRPGRQYHAVEQTWDEKNRPVALRTFDADGRPAVDGGVIGQNWTYDARGNIAGIENVFGPDGPQGTWARIERTWDAFGRATSSRSFDAEGKPFAAAASDDEAAFAGVELAYDAFGRVTSTAWFAADGPNTPCEAGFSTTDLEWDDLARTLRVVFRHEGAPVVLREGAAYRWWGKPGSSSEVKPMHQDQGLLGYQLRGIAGLDFELDTQRRVVAGHFLGPDLEPTVVDGVAGYRQLWDRAGRVVEVSWVDASGARAIHSKLGWSVQRLAYDAAGEVSAVTTGGL